MLSKDEIIETAVSANNKVISGIYFLIQNSEIIYIGSSKDIYTRLKLHKKVKRINFTHLKIIQFDIRKEFYKVDYEAMQDLERKYIEKFTPIFNFQWNPEVKKGKREIIRTYMNHFKSAYEVENVCGVSSSTVYKVIFNKGKVRNQTRKKVEDAILSRATSDKLKDSYLEHRLQIYGI